VLEELAVKKNITNISDDHIVAWANETVKGAGKSSKMKSFKDSTLKNSLFLLELITAIEPRAIDWDSVSRFVPVLTLSCISCLSYLLYLIRCFYITTFGVCKIDPMQQKTSC
jgi:hypothetical protein